MVKENILEQVSLKCDDDVTLPKVGPQKNKTKRLMLKVKTPIYLLSVGYCTTQVKLTIQTQSKTQKGSNKMINKQTTKYQVLIDFTNLHESSQE